MEPVEDPEHIIRQLRQARKHGITSENGQKNALDTMPVSDLEPTSPLTHALWSSSSDRTHTRQQVQETHGHKKVSATQEETTALDIHILDTPVE